MKWIIYQSITETGDGEWEPIGSIFAATESQAVRAATAWTNVRRPLRARSWTSATDQDQQDAEYEDQMRERFANELFHSLVAALMLGVTTACATDYIEFERALESILKRPLRRDEKARIIMAYVSAMFSACSTSAKEHFSPASYDLFRRQLQKEFVALVSMDSESLMPMDEWLAGTALFESSGSEAGTSGEIISSFGAIVAEILNARADPEVVGQSRVMLTVTLQQLRFDHFIAQSSQGAQ